MIWSSRKVQGARCYALLGALVVVFGCASSPQAAPAPASPSIATQPRQPAAVADTAATPPAAARTDAAAAPLPIPTEPPTLGPVRPLTLPPIIERRLPNGLRLLMVEHHELPLVDAVLLVRSGAESDPADRQGLATLTAAMLMDGAGGRNALDISDQAAFLGISLGAGSGWGVSRVALHAPTAKLDSAFALLADVVLRPSFPEEELVRRKHDRVTSLIQLRDRGPSIANRIFPSLLYGDAHPYGRPLDGTEASTEAIQRADVRRFYEGVYRPGNATMIVVGDIVPADMEARLARLFGGWEPRPVEAVALGTPPAAAATRVYLVDKPGAAQSSIRIGQVGVARSTADYFPLLVMNTILGGSFTSRLNQNLREVHGYTYGASSNFDMRAAAGPFTAGAEVTAARTDSSLIEFFKELRAIRDTVPMAELEKTKSYLQLQLPGDFETTRDIAAQLIPVALYGLPLDYYSSYSQRIGAVTQADVQRVATRYLDPTHMVTVVVGDRASVEGPVRAANIGPVVIESLPPR